MNTIANNNIDTLTAQHDLNLHIAKALVNDDVLLNAVNLTISNADIDPATASRIDIAATIRGIVATLVAAAAGPSRNPMGHPIRQVIEDADALYDPYDIATDVAWLVKMTAVHQD